MKHDVAVDDLIEGRTKPTEYLIKEKIGDSICYLLLLEAMLIEEMEKEED